MHFCQGAPGEAEGGTCHHAPGCIRRSDAKAGGKVALVCGCVYGGLHCPGESKELWLAIGQAFSIYIEPSNQNAGLTSPMFLAVVIPCNYVSLPTRMQLKKIKNFLKIQTVKQYQDSKGKKDVLASQDVSVR